MTTWSRYKNCNNCGRFPFCDYQTKCMYCNYRLSNQQIETRYWIKREVVKNDR